MKKDITNANIVFEGMDGSSKRTQSLRLLSHLKNKGVDMRMLSIPEYDNYTGALVKDYLQNKNLGNTIEQIKDDSILYTANRLQTLLEDGYYTGRKGYIFDRYTTSNMLYQTLDMNDTQKKEYCEWIMKMEFDSLMLPKPDIVFALRCSENLSLDNITSRGRETDFFESTEMQRKVRESIAFFEQEYGWIPIDVDVEGIMKSRDVISDEILSHIKKHLII